jgi:hypothetical protein
MIENDIPQLEQQIVALWDFCSRMHPWINWQLRFGV